MLPSGNGGVTLVSPDGGGLEPAVFTSAVVASSLQPLQTFGVGSFGGGGGGGGGGVGGAGSGGGGLGVGAHSPNGATYSPEEYHDYHTIKVLRLIGFIVHILNLNQGPLQFSSSGSFCFIVNVESFNHQRQLTFISLNFFFCTSTKKK